MMANKESEIKTKLTLAGEAEYKNACKEIKTNLNLVNSELQKVTAQYGKNATSIEGLKAKQDALNKKYDEQKRKISETEKQLERAKELYGENSTAVKKLETELNKNEAELIKTEQELKKNADALDKAEKEANEYTQKLKANAEQAEKTRDKLDRLSQGFASAAEKTKALSLAAGGCLTALVAGTVKLGAWSDDMNTLAAQTGVSTESLQIWEKTADLVDVSMETQAKAVNRLNKSIYAASQGNTAYAETYDKLGVALTDNNGELRSADDVYTDVLTSLSQMQNTTERNALAQQLFGKSFADLNPLLEGGIEDQKALGEQLKANGQILDQTKLDKLNELNDIIDTFKMKAAGMFADVASELSEILIPIMQALSDKIQGLISWFNGLDGGQQKVLLGVLALTAGLSPLLAVIGKVIGTFNTVTTAVRAFTTAQILEDGTVKASTASRIASTASMVAQKVAMVAGTIATKAAAAGQWLLNAAMTANPIGIIIALIAALVAAFVVLWNKSEAFRNFFIAMWEGIKTAVTAVGQFFTTTLPSFFSAAWEKIKSIFSGVAQFFTRIFTGVVDIFRNIGTKVGETISGAFKAVVNAVLSGVEKVLNAPINAFNAALGVINKIPGVNIPLIPTFDLPRLAKGGFTDGVSIAGEAGQEAVISFDKRWRKKNLSIWAQAGERLGVDAKAAMQSAADRTKANNAPAGLTVIQNIYAENMSYSEIERQAAKQFKMVVREVMA
jgi:hypothetical protein